MQLAITCTSMDLHERAPIVFRGTDEWCFQQIREIGYDGVELHIHDSDELDREKLRQLLLRHRLLLTSIGTGTAYGRDRIYLTSTDREIRRRAVERLKGHVITAADYPHAVVIIGLIKGKVSDCGSRELYEQNLVASLQECAAFAERYGVYLGLEVMNHYESDYLNRIGQGLELLDRIGSPHVQLHIDTYHMNIEEQDIGAAIREAQGRICHVHVADNDRWYVGHGHYDFAETVRALKAIDYPYAVCVESLGYPDMQTSGRESYRNMIKLMRETI